MKHWLFLLIIIPVLSAACQGTELLTADTPDSAITQTHVAHTLAAPLTAWPATSPPHLDIVAYTHGHTVFNFDIAARTYQYTFFNPIAIPYTDS